MEGAHLLAQGGHLAVIIDEQAAVLTVLLVDFADFIDELIELLNLLSVVSLQLRV